MLQNKLFNINNFYTLTHVPTLTDAPTFTILWVHSLYILGLTNPCIHDCQLPIKKFNELLVTRYHIDIGWMEGHSRKLHNG